MAEELGVPVIVNVGVNVGENMALVLVGVAVGVEVKVNVLVLVAVKVNVGDTETVGDALWVLVGLAEAVAEGDAVREKVGVGVLFGVFVGVEMTPYFIFI